MNRAQRAVLVVAALVVAGMAVYPPWKYTTGESAGYSWVFNPPVYSERDPLGLVPDKEWRERMGRDVEARAKAMGLIAHPDVTRLALQTFATVVLAAALFVAFGKRDRAI